MQTLERSTLNQTMTAGCLQRAPSPRPGSAGLSSRECVSIARMIAKAREDWLPNVDFDPEKGVVHLLHQDSVLEAWLSCWLGQNDTGWLDYGESAAGVIVVQGSVMQEVPTSSGPFSRRLRFRDTTEVPPGRIHRMYAAENSPGVSIHVYSPPLGRVGQYREDDLGQSYRVEQDSTALLPNATNLN